MAATEPVDADLPKALVKRIVKAKLSQEDVAHGGDGTRDFQINKDALLAFCESGKVFIHYLTATANDVCKESKRQTISADDVITALEDLDFAELVPDLKEALEGYRTEMREKDKKKAEQSKKRKLDKEQESGAVETPGEKGAGRESGSLAQDAEGDEGAAAVEGGGGQQLPQEEAEAAAAAGGGAEGGDVGGTEDAGQGEEEPKEAQQGEAGRGGAVPMQTDAL